MREGARALLVRICAHDRFFLLPLGVLFVIAWNLTPIYSNDFWIQLKVGDMIRETHQIPSTIQFSYHEVTDNPFYACEWLPSLLVSLVYAVSGYSGAIVYKAFLALAIFLLGLVLSHQINKNLPASILLSVIMILGINFRTHMRPETFAYVLFFSQMNLMVRFLATRKLRWLASMLPVTVIWANSHGSVLVNLLLPLFFLAGMGIHDIFRVRFHIASLIQKEFSSLYGVILGFFALNILASLVNPYGIHLHLHLLEITTYTYMTSQILEWLPTFHEAVVTQNFFHLYIAFNVILLVSLIIGRKHLKPEALVFLVLFGYLSIQANRHISWFFLVGLYVLAHPANYLTERPNSRRLLSLFTAASCIILIITVFFTGNISSSKPGFTFGAPLRQEAIQYIKYKNITGNVFNCYKYGDQLAYHFYPQIKILIDSRVYGDEFYRYYRSISGRSYKSLTEPIDLIRHLNTYQVRTIVTRPEDFNNWKYKGHVRALLEQGWKTTYRDGRTVIMRR